MSEYFRFHSFCLPFNVVISDVPLYRDVMDFQTYTAVPIVLIPRPVAPLVLNSINIPVQALHVFHSTGDGVSESHVVSDYGSRVVAVDRGVLCSVTVGCCGVTGFTIDLLRYPDIPFTSVIILMFSFHVAQFDPSSLSVSPKRSGILAVVMFLS